MSRPQPGPQRRSAGQPDADEALLQQVVAAPGGARLDAIASQFVVTLDTVKRHVSNVLGKLGAANPHRGRQPRTRAQPDPLTRSGRCGALSAGQAHAPASFGKRSFNPERAGCYGPSPAGASRASRASVGLVAGGLLTTYLSWRWVLFVNVPIGLLTAAAARLVLPESARDRGRFDLAGAIVGAIGGGLRARCLAGHQAACARAAPGPGTAPAVGGTPRRGPGARTDAGLRPRGVRQDDPAGRLGAARPAAGGVAVAGRRR